MQQLSALLYKSFGREVSIMTKAIEVADYVLNSMSMGMSTSHALKTLNGWGLEIRRVVYNQVSQSWYSEERERYITHQWNPMSIFLFNIDDPYQDFQYGYTPSREELILLLREVIDNGTIHSSGIDLEVIPEVF